MNFENFIEEIKKMVKDYLGENVRVEDKTVLKNNGVKFTGIVILKENQNCVPNIYLNSYFRQYEKGRSICDIVIRNEHLKKWKVNVNDIREHAFLNTPTILKGQITPMEDVICELMRTKMIYEIENSIEEHISSGVKVTEEMVEPIIKEMMGKVYTEAKGPKMFVAGNHHKNYGSAVILYEDFLEQFAKKINSDFYILPSSTHEVLLIPVGNDEEEVSHLKRMVFEVNHTELEEEEILSDSIYRYMRHGGIITKL